MTTCVSIGMPVYNSERTIAAAILSILNQTFTGWRLLILDDGSQDKTLAVARRFNDSRIEVIDGSGHRGLPERLNQAVEMSTGPYFARMDGDDIAYPERLAKQAAFLDGHPDIDLLATSMSVFTDGGRLLGLRLAPRSHETICVHPWSGFPMAHPTWMGRIEWFRTHPYCAGAVGMEDKELLFRTYRISKFACLDEVLLAYRENALSLKKLLRARKNFARVLWRVAGKTHSRTAVARGIAGQAARAALDVCALSSGLGYRLLRHRVQPAPEQELIRWHEVRRQTLDVVPLLAR